MFVPPAFATIL